MKTGKNIGNEFAQYIVDSIESDRELYNRFYRPYVVNYAGKKLNGIYDTEKAIKGVMPLVVMGIKKHTPAAEHYFERKFDGVLKPGILLRQHIAVELVEGMQGEINDLVREKSKPKTTGKFGGKLGVAFNKRGYSSQGKVADRIATHQSKSVNSQIYAGQSWAGVADTKKEAELIASKLNKMGYDTKIEFMDTYTYGNQKHPAFWYVSKTKRTTSKSVGNWGGRPQFQNPGSALRKATKGNPRIHPCPTCKKPNKLTAQDKAKGYQCDDCANRDEGCGCY